MVLNDPADRSFGFPPAIFGGCHAEGASLKIETDIIDFLSTRSRGYLAGHPMVKPNRG